MSTPIIEVENLTKVFKLKQKGAGLFSGLSSVIKPVYKTVTAVDRISLSVNPGELLAFIGPNGAGKSTTIKMLIGILYPTSGKISVLGYNPTRDRQKLAYHIGSVFGQKPQLWYHLPPADTFNLFSRIYELDQNSFKQRLDYLVEAFEISDLLKTPVRKMSLGQRMRCEIVASLLHRPKIIFLDEPTIGLDIIAKKRIREVIKTLNEQEKVTIFLTSHDAGDIEALAKRTIVINHGQIIFDGTTENLRKSYLRQKIVEFIFSKHESEIKIPFGEIIEKSPYSIKIAIDSQKSSIDELVSYATNNFSLNDMNIYDQPMEDIIAAIYKEKHDESCP